MQLIGHGQWRRFTNKDGAALDDYLAQYDMADKQREQLSISIKKRSAHMVSA